MATEGRWQVEKMTGHGWRRRRAGNGSAALTGLRRHGAEAGFGAKDHRSPWLGTMTLLNWTTLMLQFIYSTTLIRGVIDFVLEMRTSIIRLLFRSGDFDPPVRPLKASTGFDLQGFKFLGLLGAELVWRVWGGSVLIRSENWFGFSRGILDTCNYWIGFLGFWNGFSISSGLIWVSSNWGFWQWCWFGSIGFEFFLIGEFEVFLIEEWVWMGVCRFERGGWIFVVLFFGLGF